MKKICALTMVRDDSFFLERWINYYANELGRENLYVFVDGKDQIIPDFCAGINITLCERVHGQVAKADKGRINFLSDRAAELFEKYDIVLGMDVDEFLVIDPALGLSLKQYLSDSKQRNCLSALGVDIGQHLTKEKELKLNEKILPQRAYAYLSSRYTKANIMMRPLRWGSGFHRVKGCNLTIDKNLYLFHLGSVDMKMLENRISSSDRLANGWARHLRKRARTMFIITEEKIRDWDKTVASVRKIQSYCRPIYALNKPSVPFGKHVVRIPERFNQLL